MFGPSAQKEKEAGDVRGCEGKEKKAVSAEASGHRRSAALVFLKGKKAKKNRF